MRALAAAVALSLATSAGAAAKPGKPLAEAPIRAATAPATIAYSRCSGCFVASVREAVPAPRVFSPYYLFRAEG